MAAFSASNNCHGNKAGNRYIPPGDAIQKLRRGGRVLFRVYYPPLSFRVSEATRNRITTKSEFCHSEHRRCEESMLLSKHKFFYAALALLLVAKVT